VSKIVATTFVSLDGVMEAPNKWQFPNDLFDEAMGPYVGDTYDSAEALLLGRRTYEEFAAFWPTQPDSDPFAAQLNGLKKYVVSRTLRSLSWKNSTQIDIERVADVKERHSGNILIPGSAQLINGLTPRGLIDEYQVIVHPIFVGRGKRLFGEGLPPTLLQLVDTKTFGTGVVGLTYRAKGAAKLG
jgi:dihydrofolate reductase